MKNTVLTAFSSVFLLIVYDDDEVSVDAMKKEMLEFRFHILFINTSFIVIFDLRVKENELMITVLKSENVINDEVLAIYIKAVMMKNNLVAAV